MVHFYQDIGKSTYNEGKNFEAKQEGYKKDVDRCFGILQARSVIIRGSTQLWNDGAFRSIMMTCIILHNMIVEDKYNYNKEDLDKNTVNNSKARIYQAHDSTEEHAQHDLIERDWRYHNMII